jgi:transposase
MPAGYDKVLRVKVITEVFGGRPTNVVAKAHGLSVVTVRRWIRQARLNKVYAAKPSGRPRRSKLDAHFGFVKHTLKQAPSMSIKDLGAAIYENTRIKVSDSTLWEFLEKHGINIERRRAKYATPKK